MKKKIKDTNHWFLFLQGHSLSWAPSAGLYSTLTGWVGAQVSRNTAVLALPVLRAVAVVVLLSVEAVCAVLAGVGVAVVMINL